MTPSGDFSSRCEGNECAQRGMNVLDVSQLALCCVAEAAVFWMTPGYNCPIVPDCGKGRLRRVHSVNVDKLFLNRSAVTPIERMTPRNDGAVRGKGSECLVGGIDMAYNA
mmetsp:Transcript_53395/g.125258  ORF Transcript_53395/g.125258 Transcript_53395/m.125258 type:complete len:110 (-) Transcript_53395:449-778(-)